MKKYVNFILLISLSLIMSSCFGSSGGKNYEVKSSTTRGKAYIKKYNVKYHVKKHYSILLADLYEGEGKMIVEKNKKYYILKPEFTRKYDIRPNYSLWESYGWIPVVIGSILLFKYTGIFFEFWEIFF